MRRGQDCLMSIKEGLAGRHSGPSEGLIDADQHGDLSKAYLLV